MHSFLQTLVPLYLFVLYINNVLNVPLKNKQPSPPKNVASVYVTADKMQY